LLFDLRPKSSRSDLFNGKDELRELDRAVSRGYPLTLARGIGRIGKTSLVKVFWRSIRGLHRCQRSFKTI
jgi:hypothetical protein